MNTDLATPQMMHTELRLFEDTINPEIHAKLKRKLRPLAEKLETQCLLGAKQTLAARPQEQGATSMRTCSRTDRDALGLFCAVSLSRLGAAQHLVRFRFEHLRAARPSNRDKNSWRRQGALERDLDRCVSEPQHGNNMEPTIEED